MKNPLSPAKLVKDVLERKGISQAKLADMLGEHASAFNRTLNRDDLSISQILRISQQLNHNFLYELAMDSGISHPGMGLRTQTIDELITQKIQDIVHATLPKGYSMRHIPPAQLNEG